MKACTIRFLGIGLFVFVGIVDFAGAHDRTTSYSSWRLSGRHAEVTLTMTGADVAALPLADLGVSLAQYATRHLMLLASDVPCPVEGELQRLGALPGRVRLQWMLAVPVGAALEIRSDLFAEVNSGHLHFASLHRADGVAERVLTNADRSWRIQGDASGVAEPLSMSLWDYVLLGVEHIASGFDHLVFLFALVLSGVRLGSLARVVTGFTVGHSITLALASLDVVRPERQPIEALIGLSIAVVAIENVWLLDRNDRLLPTATIACVAALGIGAAMGFGRVSILGWLGMVIFLSCYFPLVRQSSLAHSARWGIALIFGLIHGFGFASVLQEADLPTDRLAGALVGFNLGVEVGQIAIVAAAWPLLQFAMTRWRVEVVEVGSAAALGLGLYWMVGRNYP